MMKNRISNPFEFLLYFSQSDQFYTNELRSATITQGHTDYILSFSKVSNLDSETRPCTMTKNYDHYVMKVNIRSGQKEGLV